MYLLILAFLVISHTASQQSFLHSCPCRQVLYILWFFVIVISAHVSDRFCNWCGLYFVSLGTRSDRAWWHLLNRCYTRYRSHCLTGLRPVAFKSLRGPYRMVLHSFSSDKISRTTLWISWDGVYISLPAMSKPPVTRIFSDLKDDFYILRILALVSSVVLEP